MQSDHALFSMDPRLAEMERAQRRVNEALLAHAAAVEVGEGVEGAATELQQARQELQETEEELRDAAVELRN